MDRISSRCSRRAIYTLLDDFENSYRAVVVRHAPGFAARLASDSPLEEDGFEPLVPRGKGAASFLRKASSIPVTAAGEFTREGQPGNFG
jgi:hypothetical protein